MKPSDPTRRIHIAPSVAQWRISIANRIFNGLFRSVAMKRKPDFTIGDIDRPYLHRWWLSGRKTNPDKPGKFLPRSILGLASPYLHCFMRSDDDRALHDHPAASFSLILCGSCVEHTIDAGGIHRSRVLSTGMVRLRSARGAHRIEIEEGAFCWTLFVFGPKFRAWGFHHATLGWIPWQKFTDPDNAGLIRGDLADD